MVAGSGIGHSMQEVYSTIATAACIHVKESRRIGTRVGLYHVTLTVSSVAEKFLGTRQSLLSDGGGCRGGLTQQPEGLFLTYFRVSAAEDVNKKKFIGRTLLLWDHVDDVCVTLLTHHRSSAVVRFLTAVTQNSTSLFATNTLLCFFINS
eukprot:scaffold2707_cov169-Amphora_coffeaeformis.AAC.8